MGHKDNLQEKWRKWLFKTKDDKNMNVFGTF